MKRMPLLLAVLLVLAQFAGASTTQYPVPSRGLDRIDQRNRPLNDSYVYDADGGGVRIYVVDTGVKEIHEFAGRIAEHWDFVTQANDFHPGFAQQRTASQAAQLPDSCTDHGTNVASIAAGTLYGVAKQAAIVDIRVHPCRIVGFATDGKPIYDDTRAQPSDFIAALNHIAATHPPGQPGVVNLSSTWEYQTANERTETERQVDEAIRGVAARGLVVAIAGTEFGHLACTKSTASMGGYGGIIAVSSSTLDDQYRAGGVVLGDSSSTGAGPCIDVFAPTRFETAVSGEFGGTSASTPLVAGTAATLLSMNPWMILDDVELWIKENATPNILTGVPGDTANRLLHTRIAPVSTSPGVLRPGETGYGFVQGESGATYQWTVQNGTILGSSTGTTVNFRAGCGGQVTLKVAVTAGGYTKYGWGRVQVLPATGSVSGSTTINYGQSATLSLAFTGTGPWSVVWQDGTQQTYTTANATRTVSPSETTTYRLLNVRDSLGCSGTVSGYATVTVTGCAPGSAQITTAPSNYSSNIQTASVPQEEGATYSWSVINGTLLMHQSTNLIQFRLGCSGTTTVSVTKTRACGAQSSSSAPVSIVRSNAVLSPASQTIQAGQSGWILVQYTGAMPWSIIWSDGEAQYNINQDYIWREVTPATTTTYTAAEVRDRNWCLGTSSGSATVTVQP